MIRIQTCKHVIGASYLFIISCRHNRRSFVYCVSEAFKKFSPTEEITIFDFYCLVQMVCPDIPFALIEGSTFCGCEPVDVSGKLYKVSEITNSLYFYFIFTEWIMMLENLYFDGNLRNSDTKIPLNILHSKFEEWNRHNSKVNVQPTIASLHGSLNYLRKRNVNEATFDQMIRALLQMKSIQTELTFTPTPVEYVVSVPPPLIDVDMEKSVRQQPDTV